MLRRQRSIPARHVPLAGGDALIDRIAASLGDPRTVNVLVLHGLPSVGRQNSRPNSRDADKAPGTFKLDADGTSVAVRALDVPPSASSSRLLGPIREGRPYTTRCRSISSRSSRPLRWAGRHGTRLTAVAWGLPVEPEPRWLSLATRVRRRADTSCRSLASYCTRLCGSLEPLRRYQRYSRSSIFRPTSC
jgi:hypothetical protein